jgi:hypothetical protein
VVGSFDESSHPGSHLVENKYQRLPPIHILMRASARERERESRVERVPNVTSPKVGCKDQCAHTIGFSILNPLLYQ